ncbi:hypothetical protein RFI_29828 [Reticulomyxa filosa]|uniref:Kelch motif family protein n=1 Tax=Reticulomyxa filosa TaxID=46433 RepID=X6M058_RETFI|nr:hypothetical protein RFI_29828 [Reticulomyxa filosa]|eukprot:ETO07563.1 hypothetical protein RFI_29828 [Reticulomyxa filosa]
MSKQTFQILKELPITFAQAQCVLYKNEILICGGYERKTCYSYHTLKNKYKFICNYPDDVRLEAHCVVKLINNNNKDSNQIILLSLGGISHIKKHALVMKYVSVWSNILDISNKSSELNNYNQWIPFTCNDNRPIIFGGKYDSYCGARAVVGGRNNNLLFITYYYDNISVFNLNTFKFNKHCTLPTNNCIGHHCFVSKSENEQGQEIMKTNEEKNKQNQMLLFCMGTGLSIEYNEDNNTFQFYQLPVCDDIAPLYHYAYVRVNNIILFFGGWNDSKILVSKSVHMYLIRENKWMKFRNTLPRPLYDCIATLNEEDNHIHIIGGKDYKKALVSTHVKTKVRVWDPLQLSKNEIKCIIKHWTQILKIKLGWIDDFDKIIIKYSK